MVTWLTRSLLFIVVGAVLAYAVTVHNDHIDVQTTGVILLLVGVFDLLLNFGLTMYLRQPLHHEMTARPYTGGRSYSAAHPYPADPTYRTDGPTGQRPPTERRQPVTDDDERNATRPIPRDHPDWH